MQKWTLAESQAGQYRRHVNFGGSRRFWCSFDYVAEPLDAVQDVVICMPTEADPDTTRWFPDLKKGMQAGLETLRDDYSRMLIGVRVIVTKIYTHPVDTTERGCQYHGKIYLIDLVRGNALRRLTDG